MSLVESRGTDLVCEVGAILNTPAVEECPVVDRVEYAFAIADVWHELCSRLPDEVLEAFQDAWHDHWDKGVEA
tara:strand:- start:15 stop:233 length:219 start_codon:yes stop_codon:yes gene_type:complete